MLCIVAGVPQKFVARVPVVTTASRASSCRCQWPHLQIFQSVDAVIRVPHYSVLVHDYIIYYLLDPIGNHNTYLHYPQRSMYGKFSP